MARGDAGGRRLELGGAAALRRTRSAAPAKALSVFAAIDLDDAVRAQAAGAIDPRIEAKWLPAAKLHLTVVFLGNAEPQPIVAKLDALCAEQAPFSLELRGSGVFVTERAAAVLWLGVGGDLDALHALRRRAGFSEPYAPHVTLGRAQVSGAFDEAARRLTAFASARFEVRHLTLYESAHGEFRALHRSSFGRGNR